MTVLVAPDDPLRPDVAELLATHVAFGRFHSPPCSAHAMEAEALSAGGISFWTAREDGALLGCGALKRLDDGHAEIKSMHTAEAHRGRGIGAAILAYILAEARLRSYRRISLETGSMEAFAPAVALYRRFGFEECPPFASYREDPNSLFMTLDLDEVRW